MMKNFASLWGLAMLIGFALAGIKTYGCGTTGCATMPPVRSPDAGPATCLDACRNRDTAGCPKNDGCLQLCIRIDNQIFTDCVASARTCKEVNKCDLVAQ